MTEAHPESSANGQLHLDEQDRDVNEDEPAVQKTTSPSEDIQNWRRQLLRGIFRVLAIIGAPAVLLGSYSAYMTQDMWLIPIYLLIYAIVVLATFWRRAPYAFQVWTILGLMYGWGILELADAGMSGEGRTVLLMLPYLATLFLGLREGILALVLAPLTLTVFGWAYSVGWLAVSPDPRALATDMTWWLNSVMIFLLLGAMLVVIQNYLFPRLVTALTQSRKLAQELELQQAALEQRVAERTRALQEANYALQRRAVQLETSAEVGQAIISIFDVDLLLRKTMELIRDRFGFYHAGIFLLDETEEWAVLREATGEAGAQMKAQGHRLAVAETSMVGWTALHRQPRVALDVGKDAIRFANPLLPYTHSEMTLPLLVGERLLGVLNVQSTEIAAFDEEDIRALQSMANQIAIAIENARKVSDQALLLEAASPIYRASRRLAQAATIGEVADSIIASVTETGADGCDVVEFEFSPAGEPEALVYRGVWRRDQEPDLHSGTRLPATESLFPVQMAGSLWMVADVAQDDGDEHIPQLPPGARQAFGAAGVRAVANVPLRVRENVIGHVVVSRATPGPFSAAALRLYETLSDQAAMALERAQLWEEAQRRAEQERVARQMIDHIRRATDVEQALHTTVEELSQALRVPHVSIELGLESPLHK